MLPRRRHLRLVRFLFNLFFIMLRIAVMHGQIIGQVADSSRVAGQDETDRNGCPRWDGS